MIKHVRPFGRLPPNDPFEQLASPSAEKGYVVRTSKFSYMFESQTSDIREIWIAVEGYVHQHSDERRFLTLFQMPQTKLLQADANCLFEHARSIPM